MKSQNFILNDMFQKNAKIYQTKPIKAMRYQPGMETGWLVYFSNVPTVEKIVNSHEGMKFFDTEADAWEYINADNKQYINENGTLIQIDVVYEAPMPILHRKINNPDERVGYVGCHEGKYAFVSNESEQYDFFFLDNNTCDKPTWIIQESDGSIRTWDVDFPECCGETFFGKEDEFIYEKCMVSGREEYLKVTV